jgi:hypothetical protein
VSCNICCPQVIGDFKPVANNKEGSYLTMWSLNGLVFGIINVIGNFGTVFVDQSYWQGAIGGEALGFGVFHL